MKAGRELDNLMATEVMGWVRHDYEAPILGTSDVEKWTEWTDETGSYKAICGVWKPSEDITAAWPLHLAICGASFTERHDYLLALGPTICERLRKEAVPPLGEHESIDWPWLLSALEPVDICLATLKAKGIDV